jgi:hypothetical protein
VPVRFRWNAWCEGYLQSENETPDSKIMQQGITYR